MSAAHSAEIAVVVAAMPQVADALTRTGQFRSVHPVATTGALRDLLRSGTLTPGAADKIFVFSDMTPVDTPQGLDYLIRQMTGMSARVVVVATTPAGEELVAAVPSAGLLKGAVRVNTVLGAIGGMDVVVQPVGPEANLPLDTSSSAGALQTTPVMEPPAAPASAASPFTAAAGGANPFAGAQDAGNPFAGAAAVAGNPFAAPSAPPTIPQPPAQTPPAAPVADYAPIPPGFGETAPAAPVARQAPAAPEPNGFATTNPFAGSQSPPEAPQAPPMPPQFPVAAPQPPAAQTQPAQTQPAQHSAPGFGVPPTPFEQPAAPGDAVAGNPFAAPSNPNPFAAPAQPASAQQPASAPAAPSPFTSPAQQGSVAPGDYPQPGAAGSPFAAPSGFSPEPAPAAPSPFAAPAGAPTAPAVPAVPAAGPVVQQGVGASSPFAAGATPVMRAGATEVAERPARRGYVISVIAPKGGTGKSSLSINLAAYLGLRTEGQRTVALLDANLQQADTGKYMKAMLPNIESLGKDPSLIHPDRIASAMLHKPELNLSVLLGPMSPDVAFPVYYTGKKYSQILEAIKPNFDYIIIDTPVAEFYHDMFRQFVLPKSDFLLVTITPNVATVLNTDQYLRAICSPKRSGGMDVDPNRVGVALNRAEEEVGLGEEDVMRDLAEWNYLGAIPETKEWKKANNNHEIVARQNFAELNEAFSNILYQATGDELLRTGPVNLAQASAGGNMVDKIRGLLKRGK